MVFEVFFAGSYMFNPYLIPSLVTAVAIISLGIIVLLKNYKAPLNRALFAFATIVLGGWLVSTIFLYSSSNDLVAFFWSRSWLSFIAFIPPLALLVSVLYLKIENQKWIVIPAFIFSFCSVLAIWSTKLVIEGVINYSWGYYPKAGILHIPYFFIFGLILIVVLFNYYRGIHEAKTPHQKLLIKLIFFGYIFGTLGATDYLPMYGVDFFPFGYLTTYFYIFLHVYAIKKHNLFVAPVNEAELTNKNKYDLNFGHSYIVNSESGKTGVDIFIDQVLGGKHGLLITRENPVIIKENTPLKKTPIIWLTEIKGENTIDPSHIEEVSFAITKFIESSENCVVFIEGIPYLTSYSDFNLVLRVLRTLKDAVSVRKASMIVSINPKNFDETQFSLIEDEFEELIHK